MKLELKSIENYCVKLETINKELLAENKKLKAKINSLEITNHTLNMQFKALEKKHKLGER